MAITNKKKKPFHEEVAEKLIKQLKQGTAPWQRPWEPGFSLPVNPTTGNRYRGINVIQLMSQNRDDNRWMTYKQAKSIGAQVKKGEKGTPIQYWKFHEEKIKKDPETGKPVLGEDGKPVIIHVKLERPRVFTTSVFNAEQIDGLPPVEKKSQNWSDIKRAELILKNSSANIQHSDQDRAFYRQSTDSIHLPNKEQFSSSDKYYATALHELGHWTGHPSRLDRDLSHPFGSIDYAKEELRAEISSMMIGEELGIGHDPGQHVAYVDSWIKVLEDDPTEIFKASADAEKIQEYVLGMEHKLEQNQENDNNINYENNSDIEIGQEPATDNNIKQELWVINQVKNDLPALEKMNKEQLNNTLKIVEDMQPVGITNEFWQRHESELPEEQSFSYKVGTAETVLGTMIATYDEYHKVNKANSEVSELEPGDQNKEVTKQYYINVPFKEKEEAKSLGAKWDGKERSWYVPEGIDKELFNKWTQKAVDTKKDKIYLAVPYEERAEAKKLGAKWDKSEKSWYADKTADINALKKWLPDNVKSQEPAMNPQEEFAEALRSVGAVVDGNHPMMDGNKHRISVEGDKKGEKAGFYVGHLDGRPAGYIKNNRSGVELKWKSKGYSLSKEEKARLQAEAAAKKQMRQEKIKREQESVSKRVIDQAKTLIHAKDQTTYMKNKGIKPLQGALTDLEGKKTYLPVIDVNNKQWSMQYIQEDGTKRFAKDGKKEGCFHVVGGDLKSLEGVDSIVISEGYATASTLSESLVQPTIAAFDSSNLVPVAKSLKEKFPEKSFVIAGDDDKYLEKTDNKNPGKEKAIEAAEAVNGKAVFPIFAPGENDGSNKEMTDFNDLANKSKLGKVAVKRQMETAVQNLKKKKIQKKNQENVKIQEQEKKKVRLHR